VDRDRSDHDPKSGDDRRLLDELLDELLELPAGARADWLLRRCAEHPSLADELASLAAHIAVDDPGLSGGVWESAPALLAALTDRPEEAASAFVGRRFGPWRTVSVLGEGGMGTVLLAEREDGAFEQEVAIKIAPRTLASRELRRRFVAERRILARLAHPSIARLLDGGVDDHGLPYLVMERVLGEPIDRWCDRRALPIERRLELFLEVCDAVQYAHQKLVVHRDLKPGNVFVTAEGRVQLLDFGVAKLLDPEPDDPGLTRTRPAPFTPAWASPEQLRGEEVTTASDVYSLGLLLHRLLSGGDAQEAASPAATASEARTRPTHRRPSDVAREQLADRLPARELTGWCRRLRGDLDRIVLMALRPEPERRYPTADQLADDLRRHRSRLPVRAREDSWSYRARRFASRNRLQLAAAGAVLAALVAGLAGTAWQARVAARERDAARRHALEARRVTDFLVDLFEVADPVRSLGKPVTARELLDRGATRLRGELSDEPAARAALLGAIGRAQTGLGRYEEAIPLLEESLNEIRRTGGETEVASAALALGVALAARGEYGRAEPLVDEAVGTRRRLVAAGGLAGTALAEVLDARGRLLQSRGRFVDAEAAYREALELRRRELGPDDPRIARSHERIGGALGARGERAPAIAELQRAVAILDAAEGAPSADLPAARNGLGVQVHAGGDFQRAEALYLAALAEYEALFGPDHPLVADSLNNAAKAAFDRGDVAAAERHARRAVELNRRIRAPENFEAIAAEINLGHVERELGHLETAEKLYRGALERFRALLGEAHPFVAIVGDYLGLVRFRRADIGDAERLHRRALELYATAPGTAAERLGVTHLGLGRVAMARGRRAEAETHLREALERFAATAPESSWSLAEARLELGACLARRGAAAEAHELLAAAHAGLVAARGPDAVLTRRAARELSRLAMATESGRQGDRAPARESAL
jgi:serine/threonine-protein kinase